MAFTLESSSFLRGIAIIRYIAYNTHEKSSLQETRRDCRDNCDDHREFATLGQWQNRQQNPILFEMIVPVRPSEGETSMKSQSWSNGHSQKSLTKAHSICLPSDPPSYHHFLRLSFSLFASFLKGRFFSTSFYNCKANTSVQTRLFWDLEYIYLLRRRAEVVSKCNDGHITTDGKERLSLMFTKRVYSVSCLETDVTGNRSNIEWHQDSIYSVFIEEATSSDKESDSREQRISQRQMIEIACKHDVFKRSGFLSFPVVNVFCLSSIIASVYARRRNISFFPVKEETVYYCCKRYSSRERVHDHAHTTVPVSWTRKLFGQSSWRIPLFYSHTKRPYFA